MLVTVKAFGEVKTRHHCWWGDYPVRSSPTALI